MKLLLKRVFLCVSAVAGAPLASAQDWEHVRVIGQRLGVPRVVTIGGFPPRTIAIADFDGDGDADIAVSETGARRVSVLLGDASSPFTATLVAPRTDWSTVDADIDVNGAGYRVQSSALSSITSVLTRKGVEADLQVGLGRSATPTRKVRALGTPEGRPLRIPFAVAGDFDGDGVIEITAAPPGSSAIAIGDFDADGFADLVASPTGSTSLTLLFGDAQGRFSRRRTIDVGVVAAPAGLAAGDINNDGVTDVALLGDSDTVSVLIGDGAGGLVPMTHITVGRSPPVARGALAATSADLAAYEGINSLTLNPLTIAGGSGATSTGTITLNAPAPAGGVVVTLASSNLELAASESTIVVPAGASTASFTIGTNRNYRRYSGLAFSVTISATHGATTRSATLAVTAQPRPGTLSSFDVQNRGRMCFGVGVRRIASGYELEFGSAGNLFDCVPPSNPVGQDGTCTFRQECALGCELRAPQNGSSFRDVCATAGPFPVAVNPKLVVGGNESDATLRLSVAAPANSSGTLSSMTVLANTFPNISTPIPVGATTATADVLTARVATPQFAPIDGRYLTPRSDGSRSGRIGLTWLALTPGASPAFRLTSFTFDPPGLTSVVGGATLFAFGQMNQVAPAPAIATATMTVTSSHPSVASVPQPNVTFTEGSSNAGVGIQTHAVSTDTLVTLSAALGETTLTRQVLVKATPGATRVDHFFLDPLDVPGGTPSTATVILNGTAPSGGAVVTLQSGNTAVATMPASATVPAGSDRVNFTVTTFAVSASTSVSLTARFNGTFAITSLLVTASSGSPPPPPPPSQATLTVTATGRSGERVTSSPAGINVAVGSTGAASFATGTSITLSVSNGRDAIWSGACSSSGSKRRTCTFTLNANASVTANVQ